MNATELRIILVIASAWIIFALIYFAGRSRKPGQGRRKFFQRDGGERVEPTFGEIIESGTKPAQGELDVAFQGELDRLGSAIAERRSESGAPSAPVRKGSTAGIRPPLPVDRIVTLHVAARPGETIQGASLIVVAEKAGLIFGDKSIFHRLVTGRPDAGPIFSMANMVKPGSFDMREIDSLRTPGVTFFMALPGPVSALDGWDTLLPTAQRMAELAV